MELSTIVENEPAGVILRAAGELDIATVPAFLEAGQNALSRRPLHLTLDLTRVVFIDIRGASSLVTLQESAEVRGTEMRLESSRQVSRLLRILHLWDRFS